MTENKQIKIIFFGTPEYVVPLQNTINQHFQLVCIVTTPDKPVGRKKILTQSPVAHKASQLAIPILKPSRLNDPALIKQLTELQPDLFVVASYGKIIPQSILDIPKYGAINIHPSRLPEFRGASPIQNTILNGIQDSAITFIKMDAEMDHGPIIYTKDFRLSDDDNFNTLSKKMFYESARILPEIITGYIKNHLVPTEQDHQKATFTGYIKKEDSYFDIENPPAPEQLNRMIRAYSHWPNVWTKWNGKIVKLIPNPLVIASEAKQLLSDKYLIQIEGKNPVKLKEFLNGYPTFPLKNL